jgi:integrase
MIFAPDCATDYTVSTRARSVGWSDWNADAPDKREDKSPVGRPLNKLTDLEVKKRKAPGWMSDGGCLFVRVSAPEHGGSKRFVFRYTFGGRKREMGLGDANSVPLAEARDAAKAARGLIRAGTDPIRERQAAKAAAAAKVERPTFGDCVESEIRRRRSGWRSGNGGRSTSEYIWRMSLSPEQSSRSGRSAEHVAALKRLNAKAVDDIERADVIDVLQDYWDRGLHVSAARLRDRIRVVIDHAIAHGWRELANPISREVFEKVEPAQSSDDETTGHHPSIPFEDMPAFMAKLATVEAMSSLTLQFIALTACRLNEVRSMRWDEVDFAAKVFTVPPIRLKAKKSPPHRVPLSAAAMAILEKLCAVRTGDIVFWGATPNRPIAPESVRKTCKIYGGEGASIHGTRASFRSWCDETGVAFHIAEKCGAPCGNARRARQCRTRRGGEARSWSGCGPMQSTGSGAGRRGRDSARPTGWGQNGGRW